MTTNIVKKAAGAINTNGLHTDTNSADSPTGRATQQTQIKVIASPNDFALTIDKTEARIDSRMLAQGFGNKHKGVIALIERYADELKALGILPFKKEVITGRGQPERYCLLNEDQAYLLLSLSRNSGAVVHLKVKLVKAFAVARQLAEMRRTEYLPSLRQFQDVTHAKSVNSSNQSRVHMNFTKLVNKTVGIEAGQRAVAPVGKLALLVVAQQVVVQAVEGSVDHHDGFQLAKLSMQALTALITPKALPPAQTGRPA